MNAFCNLQDVSLITIIKAAVVGWQITTAVVAMPRDYSNHEICRQVQNTRYSTFLMGCRFLQTVNRASSALANHRMPEIQRTKIAEPIQCRVMTYFGADQQAQGRSRTTRRRGVFRVLIIFATQVETY